MLFPLLRFGSVLGSDKCAGPGIVYVKGATWWQNEKINIACCKRHKQRKKCGEVKKSAEPGRCLFPKNVYALKR
jgi:hypothetical protein